MKIVSLILTTSFAFAMSGCATIGLPGASSPATPTTHASTNQSPSTTATDKRRMLKAGGIGCITGGLMGLLSGNKSTALKGCVAGAIVGGIVDWRAQVNEAHEVEKAAVAAGMKAKVTTEEGTDADGNKGPKLQALVIAYDPADMKAMDPKTVAMLDRLAALMTKAKNELVVRFEGRGEVCAVPFQELTRRGAMEHHKPQLQCGFDDVYRIVVSPLPDVR